MRRSSTGQIIAGFFLTLSCLPVMAANDPVELNCEIRESGGTLSCQWAKEKKMMTADEIPQFVDMVDMGAYITLRSRRGLERTFLIDANSPQYKRLRELKKTASMSELARAKGDLFTEIEKKTIKVSDELDGQAATAELIKYDPSVETEKFKRENRASMAELEGFHKKGNVNCTSTPEFERISKSNLALQHTLSNIVLAFQAPNSCLSEVRILKDKDGAVDLRQLDGIEEKFLAECKKK